MSLDIPSNQYFVALDIPSKKYFVALDIPSNQYFVVEHVARAYGGRSFCYVHVEEHVPCMKQVAQHTPRAFEGRPLYPALGYQVSW